MKKLLFLVLAFLSLSVFMARSQDVDHHKHTVSVSFGGPAGWVWYTNNLGYYYDDYGTDLKSLYSPTTDYSYNPAFQIGYSYRVNEFRLGADLGYGSLIATQTPGPAAPRMKVQEQTQHILSLVPTAEWTYDTGRRYSAYFKAGLGAELAVGDMETKIRPAWELVFLGLRIGRRLYFMCELGVGSEYVGRAGIGYHF